jgi:hypothetical protein
MSGSPIFIVGCERSGTTFLRLLVDSHGSIACGPETLFLPSLEAITGELWHRISRFGFPREFWLQRTAEYFASFHEEYARSRGKTRWADKSPLYALHVPYLVELFPDAKIIHIIRDVPDVALSHRKAFGYKSALNAPRKWSRYIAAVRAAARDLPADQYLEVRYEQLVKDVEGTMRKVCDFVGEPWDDAVLDYQEKPHDVHPRYWQRTAARRRAAAASATDAPDRSPLRRSARLDPLIALSVLVFGSRTRKELGYLS